MTWREYVIGWARARRRALWDEARSARARLERGREAAQRRTFRDLDDVQRRRLEARLEAEAERHRSATMRPGTEWPETPRRWWRP